MLSYVLEFTIQAGQLEAFKEKAAAYTAAVQENEPDTLSYQWHLAEDGSRCLLHEVFSGSEALLQHLANVGPSLPELLAIAPITRWEVLGEASDEARAAMADFGAVHLPNLVGFTR